MADFFDKVREKIDQGVTLVTSKSKETLEVTRLRHRIRPLRQQREERIKELGNLAYEMLQQDQLEGARLKEKYALILRLEDEIKALEKEIERVKEETEQALRATSTPAKAFAYCTCGACLTETSKFCGDCGANVVEIIARAKEDLARMEICDKCGTQLSPTAKFCKKCGSPVPIKTKDTTENHSENQEIPSPASKEEAGSIDTIYEEYS